MKITRLLIALSLGLVGINAPAHAEIHHYDLENQKFSVNLPASWQEVKGMYGFPLVLLGPDNDEGHRTTIAITPTGKTDDADIFNQGNVEDITPYRQGREQWLSKYNGKSISYDDYRKIRWDGIEEAHALGYHYELPTGKFYERSLYLYCDGKKVVHIKSLVLGKYEARDDALVDRTIQSLKCTKR